MEWRSRCNRTPADTCWVHPWQAKIGYHRAWHGHEPWHFVGVLGLLKLCYHCCTAPRPPAVAGLLSWGCSMSCLVVWALTTRSSSNDRTRQRDLDSTGSSWHQPVPGRMALVSREGCVEPVNAYRGIITNTLTWLAQVYVACPWTFASTSQK